MFTCQNGESTNEKKKIHKTAHSLHNDNNIIHSRARESIYRPSPIFVPSASTKHLVGLAYSHNSKYRVGTRDF